jgi:hypothetical protein
VRRPLAWADFTEAVRGIDAVLGTVGGDTVERSLREACPFERVTATRSGCLGGGHLQGKLRLHRLTAMGRERHGTAVKIVNRPLPSPGTGLRDDDFRALPGFARSRATPQHGGGVGQRKATSAFHSAAALAERHLSHMS